MLSPFSSVLAKLDESLQTVQIQIERLRGGLDPDEDQLRRSLADACHYATILGDLISVRRSNANETDHRALDRLIHELKILRRTQRRRLRLLNLAAELSTGQIDHHRVNRTKELNQLRLQAVRELLEMATNSSQEKDLPGPTAGMWLHWACGLQRETEVAMLQTLRRDFPAVEEFFAAIDERYWVSGENHLAEFSSEAFSYEEVEGAAVESAAEALSVSALGAIEAEPADRDRLARNLLAMFEKSLGMGGAEALSLSNENPLREDPPSPELPAISTGDPSSDQTMAVPPKVGERNAENASRWAGLAETGGRPLMQPPKRLEKARIDKAAALDFLKVVDAWQLDDRQARQLLGISRTRFRQLRERKPVILEPEKLTRISLLVAISKGLNVLYGTRRGEKWVHRPHSNPLFDGAEPLKYMLKQGVEGLVKVRELVGPWSQ